MTPGKEEIGPMADFLMPDALRPNQATCYDRPSLWRTGEARVGPGVG